MRALALNRGAARSRASCLSVLFLLLYKAVLASANARRCVVNPQQNVALQPYEGFTWSDGSSADLNLRGQLPLPGGTCQSWTVQVPSGDASSSCGQSDSFLLFEMWLAGSNGVLLNPGMDIQGVLLMASRQTPDVNYAPSVSVDANGGALFDPPLATGYDNALTDLHLDASAINNHWTAQRFAVPVGLLAATQQPQTWFMSLQNWGVQPMTNIQFGIRLTCVTSTQLPCRRPSPQGFSCGNPSATPDPSSNQCSVDTISGSSSCACNSSWAGPSCNNNVTDLSNSSVWSAPIPSQGQTWTYYSVTIPVNGQPHPQAILLVEMRTTPGSSSTLQPVLQLSGRQTAPGTNVSNVLPTYNDILQVDQDKFNLQDDCMCTDCYCYLPYQALDLNYEIRQLGDQGDYYSWWIGIFNNAPYSTAPATEASALRIRARWTVGSGSGSKALPAPLCPLDCNSQGKCMAVNRLLSASGFYCACYPGYGGPYCEGTYESVPTLSSTTGFSSGPSTLSPGGLDVYSFPIDPNAIASGAVLTLTFTTKPAGAPLFLVLNPIPFSMGQPTSLGELYFEPDQAFILNSTTQVPAAFNLAGTNFYFWQISVLNSDRTWPVAATYSFTVTLPSNGSSSHFDTLVNRLQLGIIGAVAALIVLLLCFMTVRVLLMRRNNALRALTASDLSLVGVGSGGGGGGGGAAGRAPRGVPQHIADTFLTFTYDSEAFKGMAMLGSGEPAEARASSGAPSPTQRTSKGGAAAQPAAAEADAAPPVGLPAAAAAVPPPPPLPAAQSAPAAVSSHADTQTAAPATLRGALSAGGVPMVTNETAAQCSICIAAYEPGEVLRQLPCLHIYHKNCIDLWMHTHATCPNCRMPLTHSISMSPAFETGHSHVSAASGEELPHVSSGPLHSQRSARGAGPWAQLARQFSSGRQAAGGSGGAGTQRQGSSARRAAPPPQQPQAQAQQAGGPAAAGQSPSSPPPPPPSSGGSRPQAAVAASTVQLIPLVPMAAQPARQ